ncbi:Spo0B domain-containing protein [Metallumcola ferriviriculae]|uniref:Spo0B domain-containing protein n=1 Tax=Metallumcola ferriviriculae TaxID=3039180 RepID=A0AAU0UM22_9FIRM|nr:Spo0B domain-containing protein [Desulfitibacteraceae bacterium MK1]
MEELFGQSLTLLRGQKHDFLNHLQVISGLIQLGKSDQALNYIKTSITEINRDGSVAKLADSRMALFMVLLQREAKDKGVPLDIKVAESGAHLIPTATSAGAVRALAGEIIATLSTSAGKGNTVSAYISIAGQDKNMTMELIIHPVWDLPDDTQEKLHNCGCRVRQMGNTIKLIIPCIETKTE